MATDDYDDYDGEWYDDEEGTPWLKIVLIAAAVIILIAVIVILYRYNRYLTRTQPVIQAAPVSASTGVEIKGAEAPLSETGREYTYNTWVYIRDWKSGYGNPKCVLHRAASDPATKKDCPSNPSIWLYPTENKMMVRVSTMKSDSEDYDPNIYPPYDTRALPSRNTNEAYTVVNPIYNTDPNTGKVKYLDTTYSCDIGNLPMQRWMQISVVMWNRTLDIYINGKLVRSCLLPGIPLHDKQALGRIFLGHKDSRYTFNGYLSRVKYYNRAVTAQEVMDLYVKGPLPASFWWSTMKHNLKVTLDVN
jgi:hypothetical protein